MIEEREVRREGAVNLPFWVARKNFILYYIF